MPKSSFHPFSDVMSHKYNRRNIFSDAVEPNTSRNVATSESITKSEVKLLLSFDNLTKVFNLKDVILKYLKIEHKHP